MVTDTDHARQRSAGAFRRQRRQGSRREGLLNAHSGRNGRLTCELKSLSRSD